MSLVAFWNFILSVCVRAQNFFWQITFSMRSRLHQVFCGTHSIQCILSIFLRQISKMFPSWFFFPLTAKIEEEITGLWEVDVVQFQLVDHTHWVLKTNLQICMFNITWICACFLSYFLLLAIFLFVFMIILVLVKSIPLSFF